MFATNQANDFFVGSYVVLRFKERVYVLTGGKLIKFIIDEDHNNKLCLHLNMDKMYQYLNKSFQWSITHM